jgi:hypothetical protein
VFHLPDLLRPDPNQRAKSQSFDVARYAFRPVQNVSQFCHIENYSISRPGGQSKIRRSKSQRGWAFSPRPEAALPRAISKYRPFFRYFSSEEFSSVSAAALLGAASLVNEEAETCPN